MSTDLVADLKILAEIFFEKIRDRDKFWFAFLSLSFLAAWFEPDLIPIVVAAVMILPLRFAIYYGGNFPRDEYSKPFPLVSNLGNHRFLGPVVGFMLVPVAYSVLGDVFLWPQYGPVVFALGATSIVVMTWSESLYQRNFYYDQWHPDMRLSLIGLGALSLLTPVFIPLFVVVHNVIVKQFDHTPIGRLGYKLGYTHATLPLTMLLILSAFVLVGLVFEIHPHMVLFLLLCGYSAHYFRSGVRKLEYGGLYYLRENNPFFIVMNAYKTGWLSSLSEETVARLGRYSQRIRPALNGFVLLVELGAILILLAYPVAIAIATLTLVLHLMILLLTGDNFWKWMAVNTALIVALVWVDGSGMRIFAEPTWFLLSLGFIGLADGWMKPKRLGWLESPYLEYYEFVGEFDDRPSILINPVVLRPWDDVLSQGFTGTSSYLGKDPRTTYIMGDIYDVEIHKYLTQRIYPCPPDEAEAMYLVEELGSDEYDKEKTAELQAFLELFLERRGFNNGRGILSYLSSPREFYHQGFPGIPNYGVPDEVPKRLKLYRVDGIWTGEGFHTIKRTELFSIDVTD